MDTNLVRKYACKSLQLGTAFYISHVERCVENCRHDNFDFAWYIFLCLCLADAIARIFNGMDAGSHNHFCTLYLELGFCSIIASLGFYFRQNKFEK